MEDRVLEFIAALRNRGVRISLAESLESFRALQALGIGDKESFRLSLRATIIKDQPSLAIFDELFPLYFGSAKEPENKDASRHLTPDQARMIAESIRQYSQMLRKMLNKMILGQPLNEQELQELDRLANLESLTDPDLQDWKVQQMLEALQYDEIRSALEEMVSLLEKMGMDEQTANRLRRDLSDNQQALEEQLRQHAGRKIMENLSSQDRQQKTDGLYNQPFQNLNEAEMQLLHREVKRLAAIMRTRLALRLKRAKTGKLDVKTTLRANLKYGSVPVEIRHRSRIRKPRLVILCDVSTSMRHLSELMISLLYDIQDQISKTQAFAYIDHLEYITPHLEFGQPGEAVAGVLARMPSGHYNTDLGQSLEDLSHKYLDTIDHHSTFIIVGDGRNNYNDPRLDLFIRLARRSHSTIWLNPEEDQLWGRGDSDMLKYAPYCSHIYHASNLSELSTAIDQLLIESA